jgi:hypothetical protein
MSRSPILDPNTDVSDLSDDELLERIAALDEEQYPLVPVAKRALAQEDSS